MQPTWFDMSSVEAQGFFSKLVYNPVDGMFEIARDCPAPKTAIPEPNLSRSAGFGSGQAPGTYIPHIQD